MISSPTHDDRRIYGKIIIEEKPVQICGHV